jgi:hypothetical protein
MKIWIRVGDGGEYQDCGGLPIDTVFIAKILKDAGVKAFTACKGGIKSKDFKGKNYISLYWGDIKANHCWDLKRKSLTEIRKVLKRMAD